MWIQFEVDSLKKVIVQTDDRRERVRAAAALPSSPEQASEPAAAAALAGMSSRGSTPAQRAPEPTPKPARRKRGAGGSRAAAVKGIVAGGTVLTVSRDVQPLMDSVVRLFRHRAQQGGSDAVFKLLQLSRAELEAFAEETVPVVQLSDFRDALQDLESSGSTVSWRWCGITEKSNILLWAKLQNEYFPRPSELPLWTDAALFIGDASLNEFFAPLITGAASSASGDEGAQSAHAQQRALFAWQQLWVADDADIASASRARAAKSTSRLTSSYSALKSRQSAASRVLDMRLQLLSGDTARHRRLEELADINRLSDAAALVLSPPPASATHAPGGRCLLEISGPLHGDICDDELRGYDSYSDNEMSDEESLDPSLDNRFCFPVQQRVDEYPLFGSVLPPISVVHSRRFFGGKLHNVLRTGSSKAFRIRLVPDDAAPEGEPPPSPESQYARWPTYVISWPLQAASGKPSEAQQLVSEIKFLSLTVLYSQPFPRALFDRLGDKRTKLLREIAVADVLHGLLMLCDSRLLPLRCMRELKRHLLRCGIAAVDTQPLQESLRQLDTIDLVAAARYVFMRFSRRLAYLQEALDERSAEFDLGYQSQMEYVPSSDVPAVSFSASVFKDFVAEDAVDCEYLGRYLFAEPEDASLELARDAGRAEAASREAEAFGELLHEASNNLKNLLDLNRELLDCTRIVLAARIAYDALDRTTISAADPGLQASADVVRTYRVALLKLSHCVLHTHRQTFAMQHEHPDYGALHARTRAVLTDIHEAMQNIAQSMRICAESVLPDSDYDLTKSDLAHFTDSLLADIEEEVHGDLVLAHAQAAAEMLEYELGVAHETLNYACERCSISGLHNLAPALQPTFVLALRKKLIAEAAELAGSVELSLIAEEDSRKTSEDAAKAKNAAKRDKKKEAERRKREEAAAATAAAAAQRAAEEQEAAEAARAAEAALAAEKAAQQRRTADERAAALEQRAQQMEAARMQEQAEKARLRDQQTAEREAQLRAREEADHARAIAASAAEFAATSMLQQPPYEYRPPASSGAASILPPIGEFAGMDLRSMGSEPPPAAAAALPSSIFDWPPPSSPGFSLLPPSSILPPLPSSALNPSLAALQPAAGSDVSGLSNATGEYNCFLNSLVQALFRLRCFKHHLLSSTVPRASPPHRDISRDLAVVKSLQNLFRALEDGVRLLRDPLAAAGGAKATSPTDLRLALAALAPGGGEAGVNAMADAAEVLSSMYDCFLRVSSAFRSAGDISPVQQRFGLEMREHVYCDACRLTTHKMSFLTFFHLVHATALRHAAERCPAGAPLEERLAFLLAEESKSCDTDYRGCGKQTPICHSLDRVPEVFTISLGWDSSTASEAEVGATLRALAPTIFPQLVYRGTPPPLERAMFELRAMVCYYGSHYVSIVRTSEAFQGCAPACLLAACLLRCLLACFAACLPRALSG